MRLAQAVEELRQAVGQDPLSPHLHGTLGLLLVELRAYEGAEIECRAAVDLAPTLWWPHLFLGSALMRRAGRAEEALADVRQACDAFSGAPLALGCLCLTCGALGRMEAARTLLAQLQQMTRVVEVPPLALAWAYLGLGDERVFEWLARAIDARAPITTHLPGMPDYDAIRGDPRFSALLAMMHLD
jgi:Flp pilus assembly protein TadD